MELLIYMHVCLLVSMLESYYYCMAAKEMENYSLRGKTVNVSGFGLPPFTLRTRLQIVGGVDLQVIHILAQKLQFKPQVILSDGWGSADPDTGEWNGVVGDVSFKKTKVKSLIT